MEAGYCRYPNHCAGPALDAPSLRWVRRRIVVVAHMLWGRREGLAPPGGAAERGVARRGSLLWWSTGQWPGDVLLSEPSYDERRGAARSRRRPVAQGWE